MHHRKSPRASRYDYSSPGVYFVTICTRDREHYFGEIIDQKMILSEMGYICDQEIIDTTKHRPYIDIDEYIVMPDHVHMLKNLGIKKILHREMRIYGLV